MRIMRFAPQIICGDARFDSRTLGWGRFDRVRTTSDAGPCGSRRSGIRLYRDNTPNRARRRFIWKRIRGDWPKVDPAPILGSAAPLAERTIA